MIKVHYRGFTLTWWGEPTNYRWTCDRYIYRMYRYTCHGQELASWATLAEAVAELDKYSPS